MIYSCLCGFGWTREKLKQLIIAFFTLFDQVSAVSLVLQHRGSICSSDLRPCGISGFSLSCSLQFDTSVIIGVFVRNNYMVPISPSAFCPMALPLPNELIAGHSFVKRLHSNLQCKFAHRDTVDYNLVQTVKYHCMASVG